MASWISLSLSSCLRWNSSSARSQQMSSTDARAARYPSLKEGEKEDEPSLSLRIL